MSWKKARIKFTLQYYCFLLLGSWPKNVSAQMILHLPSSFFFFFTHPLIYAGHDKLPYPFWKLKRKEFPE